jgi:hypothetical protein
LGWKDDSGAKTVTVMFTYFGDTNLDGQVNTGDFTKLAQNFGSPGVWETAISIMTASSTPWITTRSSSTSARPHSPLRRLQRSCPNPESRSFCRAWLSPE